MGSCVACLGLVWLTFSTGGYNHYNVANAATMRSLTGTDFEQTVVGQRDLFVDKTMLLVALHRHRVDMIIRGRCWGKTYNLGMIYVFFAIFHNNQGEILSHKQDQRSLYFKGGCFNGTVGTSCLKPLKVSKYPEVMKKMGSHPAIYISFKNMGDSYNQFITNMKRKIINLIEDHSYGNFLPTVCKKAVLLVPQYVNVRNCEKLLTNPSEAVEDPIILEYSFYILSAVLRHFFNRGVVILIDEYDSPMHNVIDSPPDLNNVTKFIHRFFTNTFKKGSGIIYKGIITGVLRSRDFFGIRISPINEHTILDSYLAEHFGFTESEVRSLYHEQKINSVTMEDLQQWYNGYYIGGKKMYNPLSIIRCLAKNGQYGQYWIHGARSGARTFLHQLGYIQVKSPTKSLFVEGLFLVDYYREILQQLYCNYTFTVFIRRDIQIKENLTTDEYLSCLTMLGYLTAVPYKDEFYAADVQIPNKEMRDFLKDEFTDWASQQLGETCVARIEQLNRNIYTSGPSVILNFLVKVLPDIKPPNGSYCDAMFGLLLSLSYFCELHRTFSELNDLEHIECIITIIPKKNNPNMNFIVISIGPGSRIKKKKIVHQISQFFRESSESHLLELCKKNATFDVLHIIPKPSSFFKPMIKLLMKPVMNLTVNPLKPLIEKLGTYIMDRCFSSTMDKPNFALQEHSEHTQKDNSVVPQNKLFNSADELFAI